MPSRDLTYVTLVSEARDGPDEHDGMMKMIKFLMNLTLKLGRILLNQIFHLYI